MHSNDPEDKKHPYEFFEDIITLEERRGNARIIESAPEMYETLKNNYRDIKNLNELLLDLGYSPYTDMENEIRKVLDKIESSVDFSKEESWVK